MAEDSSGSDVTVKKPLGVLVLHGFTSHFNCVSGVLPRVEKYGLPTRMPALRGHQSTPQDLQGVVWHDWYDDGERALLDLVKEVRQVVVVALSMGSLVGIELTIKHPDKIAGLVCVAPALKLKGAPNALVAGLVVAPLLKTYKFKADKTAQSWGDPALFWKHNKNYSEVPTKSLVELIKFSEYVRKPEHLRQLTPPLLVIETRRDEAVEPEQAQRLYDLASSQSKTIKWFDKTSHEMLLDCEAAQVLDVIEEFVVKLERQATKATTTAKEAI